MQRFTPVSVLKAVVRTFSSLRLTVVLLGLSMVLIFVATLAQVELGLNEVQHLYLRSWIAWIDVLPGKKDFALPFPGGGMLGTLLLLNLVAAHATRFQLRWSKAGLILVHLGIIMLLLGEIFTAILAKESQMFLDEGKTSNYSSAPLTVEIAVVDASAGGEEIVNAIPQSRLQDGAEFGFDGFSLRVVKFFRNSEILPEAKAGKGSDPMRASQGPGTGYAVRELPHETAMNRRDLSSAFVEITESNGSSKGTWLLSNVTKSAQELTIEGRTIRISMRQQRYYHPFSIRLIDFSHDKYLGTDIPKNFSSRVRLINRETGEDRETLIYMNHPLRYQGLTFYQSGFDNNDRTSILQVVENPAWTMPYIACGMVSIGLLWIFMQHLVKAVRRRNPSIQR